MHASTPFYDCYRSALGFSPLDTRYSFSESVLDTHYRPDKLSRNYNTFRYTHPLPEQNNTPSTCYILKMLLRAPCELDFLRLYLHRPHLKTCPSDGMELLSVSRSPCQLSHNWPLYIEPLGELSLLPSLLLAPRAPLSLIYPFL